MASWTVLARPGPSGHEWQQNWQQDPGLRSSQLPGELGSCGVAEAHPGGPGRKIVTRQPVEVLTQDDLELRLAHRLDAGSFARAVERPLREVPPRLARR